MTNKTEHRNAAELLRKAEAKAASQPSKVEPERLLHELQLQNEELLQTQILLQSERQRLANIIEGIRAGTWEWNVQTGETIFNQQWAEIIGYKLDEILPTSIDTWMNFAHPDDVKKSGELLERHLNGELEYYEYESRMKHKNGHWIWVLDRGKLASRDEDGNPLWMFGTHQDITERKQAEAEKIELESQLRQKHKMEAMGYMAGGMAHNFNNNLSIILGNVELSQMKQAPGSEVIPLLENAKIAVRRSRDLVQKIITYSRQGVVYKAPIQFEAIIDETLDFLNLTVPTTIILKKNSSLDGGSELINADPLQIQEVLINLSNNAIHAMDEKGELNISLESVDLYQKNIPAQYDCLPGHYLKLSVQDSGCGMAAEMLDKIFDPFYSTKEEHERAGMGISTVEGIVAQHGGFIKVNSIVNQGTTFDLYFPIIEHTEFKGAAENSALLKRTEHILFVDDDERLATLGKRLLSAVGYQVSIMTESTEALKMFTANAERFDLVITDQTMPKLSGKDLIAELKKVKPDIPTILCTGYSSKVNEESARESGISAFIMKPINPTQLFQTIRQILDENKGESLPLITRS